MRFGQTPKQEVVDVENKFTNFIKQLPKEDGYLDISQLKKIGEGGSNDIYEHPQYPGFVVRIDKTILTRVIEDGGNLSPETRERAESYVENTNEAYRELYDYFGEEHCIQEHFVIEKISNTETGEVESVVSVQEKSDVFTNPNKVDFSSPYLEKSDVATEDYEAINGALLADGKFNEQEFLQAYKNLKLFFELIEKEEGFSEQVQDFVERFKRYFNDKGRFIDLMGEDNVMFFKDGDSWDFRLGSVLKAETKENLDEALELLENDPEALNQEHSGKNNLMNSLNLIRMLNAVGFKSGMGKVFDINLSSQQLANLKKIRF